MFVKLGLTPRAPVAGGLCRTYWGFWINEC